MEKKNKAQELIKKYGLSPNSYYTESPYKTQKFRSTKDWDSLMNEKWDSHIPTEWYGFDGCNVFPDHCMQAVDEFLEWVEIVDPNFEIHQIKQKFSNIRIYISADKTLIPDLYDQLNLLMNAISDKFFMW